MISAPDYILLTLRAAQLFQGLGLILGALGVALAIWLFVTGRVPPIPGKTASKMVTGPVIALTGAGMG